MKRGRVLQREEKEHSENKKNSQKLAIQQQQQSIPQKHWVGRLKKSSRKHKEKLVREDKEVKGPSGAQHFTPGGPGTSESRRVNYQRACAGLPGLKHPASRAPKPEDREPSSREKRCCLVPESSPTLQQPHGPKESREKCGRTQKLQQPQASQQQYQKPEYKRKCLQNPMGQ